MQQMTGTIYGVMLNDPASLVRLAEQFTKDPYKAAPRAPILYIKPANTVASDQSVVLIPPSPGRVQIGATIGAVIGRSATRVSKDAALSYLDGFRIVADVSLPHESFYRPAIRERCRDGFCPLGATLNPAGFEVNNAAIKLSINGRVVEQRNLADAVRPLDRLLADVTDFMTLEPGDVLLLGLSDQPPLAKSGDEISILVEGLGALGFRLAQENALVTQ